MILFYILIISVSSIWGQNLDKIIPIEYNPNMSIETAYKYRPGLNFQRSEIKNDASRKNLIESSSITIESPSVGRIGSIRLDGISALPMLGLDGFVIKDPSICQGQISLDMLGYDFCERADIYKQNLVPYGINANSFIDFRIPLNYQNSTKITAKGTSIGNIYTKIQAEQVFTNGSSFFGILGDFGVKDYYYAINNGTTIKTYPNSTYDRYSFLSKTIWKKTEFLLSHTYTKSFGETPDNIISHPTEFSRNSLIVGLRNKYKIWHNIINYTFQNQFVKSTDINDYLNHHLTIKTGIEDKKRYFKYQMYVGYEFSHTLDGCRSTIANYKGVPREGDHYINIQNEFSISVFEENVDRLYNIDFDIAINQIISDKKKYTPIPSLLIGVRHKNGTYSSCGVNRVYVTPDLTTAYGFAKPAPLSQPLVLPKDGIRTTIEIGWNGTKSRIFANGSYSWLDKGFRLTEKDTVINSHNVRAISIEIAGEIKHLLKYSILSAYTGLSFNKEEDTKKASTSVIPLWKWVLNLSAKNINNTWNASLGYRLESHIEDLQGNIDRIPRHYVDFHFKFKIFILNILNLANQSYRPIPNNIYYPYNPGARIELGIEHTF